MDEFRMACIHEIDDGIWVAVGWPSGAPVPAVEDYVEDIRELTLKYREVKAYASRDGDPEEFSRWRARAMWTGRVSGQRFCFAHVPKKRGPTMQ